MQAGDSSTAYASQRCCWKQIRPWWARLHAMVPVPAVADRDFEQAICDNLTRTTVCGDGSTAMSTVMDNDVSADGCEADRTPPVVMRSSNQEKAAVIAHPAQPISMNRMPANGCELPLKVTLDGYDGMDDDCDGNPDEDHESIEVTCAGVGPAAGILECVDGIEESNQEPSPAAERSDL